MSTYVCIRGRAGKVQVLVSAARLYDLALWLCVVSNALA